MTDDRKLNDAISTWLQEAAPPGLSERVLAATFERTRTSRQQLGWRVRVERARVPSVGAALRGAAAVLIVVMAVGVVLNQPGIGDGPSPTPPASPLVAASPTTAPGQMWPQATLEEVKAAQELADAGDPAYLWQRYVDGGQLGQHHPCAGSSAGCWRGARNGESGAIFARFIEEVLGWEEYFWEENLSHIGGLGPGDVVFVRCAAGQANPLYATEAERPACAPTMDELRYETVKITVAQPDRQGSLGIWVVTGWEFIEPARQADPRVVEAEATRLLNAFLQARIDGEGAEPLLAAETPLLYATSTGARYGRAELEPVEGPVWPTGWMRFAARLFAANDEITVEQHFSLEWDAIDRLRLVYDDGGAPGGGPGTTQNGEPVPVEYGFLDGLVTYRAAYPIGPSPEPSARSRLEVERRGPDDGAPERVLVFLADPRPVGPDCLAIPAAADAEALAASIRANPNFEATTPEAVTVGGRSALRIDVSRPPASGCGLLLEPTFFTERDRFGPSDRARLYLVDLPGGSARVLVVAIAADAESFEAVLGWAAPIVDSIGLHAP